MVGFNYGSLIAIRELIDLWWLDDMKFVIFSGFFLEKFYRRIGNRCYGRKLLKYNLHDYIVHILTTKFK